MYVLSFNVVKVFSFDSFAHFSLNKNLYNIFYIFVFDYLSAVIILTIYNGKYNITIWSYQIIMIHNIYAMVPRLRNLTSNNDNNCRDHLPISTCNITMITAKFKLTDIIANPKKYVHNVLPTGHDAHRDDCSRRDNGRESVAITLTVSGRTRSKGKKIAKSLRRAITYRAVLVATGRFRRDDGGDCREDRERSPRTMSQMR
ncbi:hypothetical protein QTP88_014266 [Uroleucon formosanum]